MNEKLIPDKVDYILKSKLGEGLSSEVFLAVRREPQFQIEQTIALKWFKSAELSERWKFEFDLLNKVKSPYCVQIMGWDVLEGRPGLLLEYLDGVNLDKLQLKQKLETQEIDFVCDQILKGLIDLNNQQLCHGDLNPSNVMIESNGKVQLIDFGLKDIKKNKLFLSPDFCPDEVLQGKKPPSFEADLYALGCIRSFLLGEDDKLSLSLKQERKPYQIKSQNSELKSLGKKAKASKEKAMSVAKQRTQVFSGLARPATSKIRLAVGVFAAAFLLIFPSSSILFDYTDYGMASFRSQKWMQVSLSGKSLGYTPTEAIAIKKGRHSLVFQGANKIFHRKFINIASDYWHVIVLEE